MVLTIRYDATGETETFLLGRRNGGDAIEYTLTRPSPPLRRPSRNVSVRRSRRSEW
ncbi:hypothetical protein MAHJHV35_46530 [Mycobacterium avium subsp. hominissuis]